MTPQRMSESSPKAKKSSRSRQGRHQVKFDLAEDSEPEEGQSSQTASGKVRGILKGRKRQASGSASRQAARQTERRTRSLASPSPTKASKQKSQNVKQGRSRLAGRKSTVKSSGRNRLAELSGPAMEQLEQHRHHRRPGKHAKAFGRNLTGGIPVASVHRRMRHQHSVMGRFSRLGSGLLALVARKTINELLVGAATIAKKDKKPTLRARHVLDAIATNPELNHLINLHTAHLNKAGQVPTSIQM